MRFSAGMVRRSRPSVSPCCARCRAAADDRGYEIDEAEVIYWGRCPECVNRDKKKPTGEEPRA